MFSLKISREPEYFCLSKLFYSSILPTHGLNPGILTQEATGNAIEEKEILTVFRPWLNYTAAVVMLLMSGAIVRLLRPALFTSLDRITRRNVRW